MVAEKSSSVFIQSLKTVASIVVLGAFIAPLHAAPVPVVESQPVTRGGGNQQAVTQPAAAPASASAPQSGGDPAGTAYFLNMMDQLRQEVMELRGQVEEQQFQINRLQQESRDRYLDLDDRISRLKVGKVARTPASREGNTQVSAETIDEALLSQDADSQGKQMAEAEEQAYQAAFKLIRERQFDESKAALLQLLVDFPNGHYSDNARYWLGEVQMAQGNYREALATFGQVLKDYPQSSKIADATYKMGHLHDLLGDKQKARELLEKVIKDYPDSAAARLSDTYLRGI